jgi:sigma-B regulation protein RsbU (phosphoserine phosphatase)
MISIEKLNERPNLQEEFAYKQIGSTTCQVEPIDVGSSLDFVIDFFKNNPGMQAIPIERDGVLIGILDRSQAEKMNESAWNRFWQKDLDAYIDNAMFTLRADDYIDKNIPKLMELSGEKGIRHYAVYYRKSFFGIASLNDMIARMTEIRARDLAKARTVQQNLLSHEAEKKDPRYTLITWNRMANEVGGDFFKDFALPDGDRHIIGSFDVSGKNVAASLSTMAVGSFFTALKHFELRAGFGQKTTVLLDKYIADLTPEDMFITAALCYVDFASNEVTIQNCGHTPVYIFVPGENGTVAGKVMNPNLPPLGMGIVECEIQTCFKVPIVKGLRIVLYTDGLTDMVTYLDGVRFGDDHTKNLFAATHGKPVQETQAIFTKTIDDWVSEAMLPDDISIMDVRFN